MSDLNNLSLAVDIIKNNVSAIDAGKAMGLNVDNHNRCSCPFHNGKDRNMKLYDGNRGFSCFVCHESGDVIKLVRKYHGMSFKDAVAWFNDTFGLGMDIDSPMDPKRLEEAKEAQRKRVEKSLLMELRKDARTNRETTAMGMLVRLEDMMERHAPRTPEDGFSQKFRTASWMIPMVNGMIEEIKIDNER